MGDCPGRGRHIEWAKCLGASSLLTEPSVLWHTVWFFVALYPVVLGPQYDGFSLPIDWACVTHTSAVVKNCLVFGPLQDSRSRSRFDQERACGAHFEQSSFPDRPSLGALCTRQSCAFHLHYKHPKTTTSILWRLTLDRRAAND